ncbi:hypothetical protein MCETHM1_02297 [Flavobacteriaceae bacterium]
MIYDKNMNKFTLTFLGLFTFFSCFSQTLTKNREQIEKSQKDLQNEINTFSSCIIKSDLNVCVNTLIKSADNEFKKYTVAGMLYEIDPQQSFNLHEQAYLTNKFDENFVLEYAIELHRKLRYKEAAKLYEAYFVNFPKDFRINVWLSDCYMNIGEVEKAIANWTYARHYENHTSIDNAIFTIYGNANQLKIRNDLKVGIEQGKISNFYPLIFLDNNWEFDWWNKGSQDYFLNEDLELAKTKLGQSSSDFKTLTAYLKIKKLESKFEADSIKKVLIDNKIILDNNPLPAYGEISSDLLRICFSNKLLDEKTFYNTRGQEILEFAKKTKDIGILNIYAYLQVTVDGVVKPEIDKLGWKEFNSEKFAKSYFTIRVDKIKSDDKELNEAMADFPNSAYLYWVKAKCNKVENKPVREHLIELIKREFRTLDTDPSRYSYRLKSYFNTLANEK